MKRSLGSILSAVVLLSLAAGAAAINVRILNSNSAETSVLPVQSAVEAAVVETTADPNSGAASSTNSKSAGDVAQQSAAVDVPAATTAVSAAATSAPVPMPTPLNGQRAIGAVAGGGGDDDDEDEGEHEGREHGEEGEDHHRGSGAFVPLTPRQAALLRVAALAQVSPMQAREAANGQGSQELISRVKSAAAQIGVPLSELAAVSDVPPEGGRRHGGDDRHEHEGDDDD